MRGCDPREAAVGSAGGRKRRVAARRGSGGYCSLSLAPPPPPRHNYFALLAAVGALLLGAALILAPPATAQSTTDYDDDNDGLIDVRSLAQLDAIRHDLNGDGDPSATGATAYGTAFPNRVTTASGRMGCPSGACTGYELRADLSFDENGDGQMTATGDPQYWNSGSGWLPLGYYAAAFRGNGHTISYLYVNRTTTTDVGLFRGLNTGSSVDGVGVLHADVTGQTNVGILAASLAGPVTRVWTTGRVAGGNLVGGLATSVATGGSIKASWSAAAVHASSGRAGGLVDSVTFGSITASWSAGRVTATSGGGLAGFRLGTVTDSYWDTGTSGWSTSPAGVGKSTRDLQRPTAYGSTGSIYANWNLNLDGNTGGDDPWDFGTSRQYPALKFTGRTTHRGPAWIEADHWNAPVAGEPLVAGLYAKTARALVTPAATITTCDGVANTDSRQAWVWERSDDGRTSWTDVSSSNGSSCSYVYVPSSSDVGKYLRARVARTSGGDAYTLTTAAVVASSAATAATASFAGGNASPVVGTAVTVSALPSHSDRTLWRWQRCTASDGTGTCTLLAPGTPSWSYTPVAADVGGYLRAFVYYSSGASTPVWTRAATGFTGAVAASN